MRDKLNVTLSLEPGKMPDFDQLQYCLDSARLSWDEGDRVRASRILRVIAFLAEQEGRRIFPYHETES